ncbi:MAG TPA: hypothetical protein DDW52_15030 [Planctomycetaceae bacterium]|nr:hypothetical protein [Planctomycetaceae bacterium]
MLAETIARKLATSATKQTRITTCIEFRDLNKSDSDKRFVMLAGGDPPQVSDLGKPISRLSSKRTHKSLLPGK